MKKKRGVYKSGGPYSYNYGGANQIDLNTTQDSKKDDIASQKTNNFLSWLQNTAQAAQITNHDKFTPGYADDGYTMMDQPLPEHLQNNRFLKSGKLGKDTRKYDPNLGAYTMAFYNTQQNWNSPLNKLGTGLFSMMARPDRYDLVMPKGQDKIEFFGGDSNVNIDNLELTGVNKSGFLGRNRTIDYKVTGTRNYPDDMTVHDPNVAMRKNERSREDVSNILNEGITPYPGAVEVTGLDPNQSVFSPGNPNNILWDSEPSYNTPQTNQNWLEQNADLINTITKFMSYGGSLGPGDGDPKKKKKKKDRKIDKSVGTTTIDAEEGVAEGDVVPEKFHGKSYHYKPETYLNEEPEYYFTFKDRLNNFFKPNQRPRVTTVFKDGGFYPKAYQGQEIPNLDIWDPNQFDMMFGSHSGQPPMNPNEAFQGIGTTHGYMDFLGTLNDDIAMKTGTPKIEYDPMPGNNPLSEEAPLEEMGSMEFKKRSKFMDFLKEDSIASANTIIGGMQLAANIGNIDDRIKREQELRERVSNPHRLFNTRGADRGDYMVNLPGVGDPLKPNQHTRMGYNTKVAQDGMEVGSELELTEAEIEQLIKEGYEFDYLD